MIVGSGLLSKAFASYKDSADVLIFASGVSNSAERDQSEYARELALLEEYAQTEMKLVYFSTVSLYDSSLRGSDYINHKIKIEEYIANTFADYVIFRLPNVVGATNNSNTFFNNIRDKIVQGEVVRVKKDAIRYLIDVDDLATILPSIIDAESRVVVDVCFNNKKSVRELVKLMSSVLGISYTEVLIDGGCDYSVDNVHFLTYVSEENVGLSQNYDYIVLNKYLNDNILSTK